VKLNSVLCPVGGRAYRRLRVADVGEYIEDGCCCGGWADRLTEWLSGLAIRYRHRWLKWLSVSVRNLIPGATAGHCRCCTLYITTISLETRWCVTLTHIVSTRRVSAVYQLDCGVAHMKAVQQAGSYIACQLTVRSFQSSFLLCVTAWKLCKYVCYKLYVAYDFLICLPERQNLGILITNELQLTDPLPWIPLGAGPPFAHSKYATDNRTLSRGSTWVGNCVFLRLEKILYFMTRV